MSRGRRAGQRFDAANGITTEALIFLGELDPEAVGPAIEFATHYEPTPIADIERLLDEIPVALESTTFVDVGSGMGRVVLLAARRPFRRVVGVEISPALHEVARENLAAFDDPKRKVRDIRLVRADASAFDFPRGDLVLYLYNPFRANILRAVLDRVLAQPPAELIIIYHTAVARDELERTGRFEEIVDTGFAKIFRLRETARTV